MKRLKLKNKKRFYSFIVFTVIFLSMTIMQFTGDNKVRGSAINEYDLVVVQNSDTIWNIANKYNNGQYKDLREFVCKIKSENNIFGDFISPNQVIKVPRAL